MHNMMSMKWICYVSMLSMKLDRIFMKQLRTDLVAPHILEHFSRPNLQSRVRQNIQQILSLPVQKTSVDYIAT